MKISFLFIYIAALSLLVSCGSTQGLSNGTANSSNGSSGDNGSTSSTSSSPRNSLSGPDDDYDGVVNSEDECPYIYGSVRTGGCPDSDGDGIRDSDDACPDNKGFANLKGCQDRDYDGIIDPEDKCPDEYGETAEGCPENRGSSEDIDGDGIKNELDECPDLAGWFTANGCPDRDGDGIRDDIDECADMWGETQYNGCPLPADDVQNLLNRFGNPDKIVGLAKQGYYRAIDGKIYDKNNLLISVIGGEIVGQDGTIMTQNGNYFIDSEGGIRNDQNQLVKLDEDNYLFIDGVGVLNIEAINSNKKGGISFGVPTGGGISFGTGGGDGTNYNGNPYSNSSSNPYTNTTTATGTNSNIYNNPPQNYTPLTASESANCNRIDLASLRAAIYFDYDAARAESNSLNQLNRVVDAMRKCASLELQVAGHADSDGSENYNEQLSAKRAKSVLRYIQGQGISETRLKYNAYGEKYPIADNSTETGKQKNRRAEIHVSRAQ